MAKSDVPVLTDGQKKAALDAALRNRRHRAGIRAKLKDGSLSIKEVLEMSGHDEALSRMPVRLMLSSLPGIGEAKVGRIMAELNISESRRLKGLGRHQKAALIEWESRRR